MLDSVLTVNALAAAGSTRQGTISEAFPRMIVGRGSRSAATACRSEPVA